MRGFPGRGVVNYCGSNPRPVSDLWYEKALALIAASFRTAVRDGQQRLLATCPRPVNEEDIARIFARSIANW